MELKFIKDKMVKLKTEKYKGITINCYKNSNGQVVCFEGKTLKTSKFIGVGILKVYALNNIKKQIDNKDGKKSQNKNNSTFNKIGKILGYDVSYKQKKDESYVIRIFSEGMLSPEILIPDSNIYTKDDLYDYAYEYITEDIYSYGYYKDGIIVEWESEGDGDNSMVKFVDVSSKYKNRDKLQEKLVSMNIEGNSIDGETDIKKTKTYKKITRIIKKYI